MNKRRWDEDGPPPPAAAIKRPRRPFAKAAQKKAPKVADRLVGSGLVKAYGHRKVVNEVDVALGVGEICGLLGPNGAGKTTTFYMLVGLISPDEGSVLLNDHDLTEAPMHQRARMGLTYLPQEPSVFRRLSVADNVMAVLETLNLGAEERQARLDHLLADLNLSHLARNKALSLSGGERRRLEITRALALTPTFLLFDEPFAGIDPIAVGDIQNLILLLRGRGLGILISDHNVRETLSVCDRAYIINEGQVLKEGLPRELADDETVRRIYLGRDFSL
ncbi:MAG: LPS export ABC transporter ATP-binding protein [Candidatus Adiutrix sp.]|jgi:lipopolysaccharide export system ATP-binding protein|nr:LPS export ABC transporter ATP-binding protein [Candidatus Adiutrix sp.]